MVITFVVEMCFTGFCSAMMGFVVVGKKMVRLLADDGKQEDRQ